jgi:hypothetical protein
MDTDIKGLDLFKFKAMHDCLLSDIRVPRTSSKKNFRIQVKKTGWVDGVLSSMVPKKTEDTDNDHEDDFMDDEEEDDEVALGKDSAAEWLLSCVGHSYPDAFLLAAG